MSVTCIRGDALTGGGERFGEGGRTEGAAAGRLFGRGTAGGAPAGEEGLLVDAIGEEAVDPVVAGNVWSMKKASASKAATSNPAVSNVSVETRAYASLQSSPLRSRTGGSRRWRVPSRSVVLRTRDF